MRERAGQEALKSLEEALKNEFLFNLFMDIIMSSCGGISLMQSKLVIFE